MDPAHQQILRNAKEKIFSKEPLTEVEWIVLRNHLTFLRLNFTRLYDLSKNQTLSAVQYDRMCRFQDELEEILSNMEDEDDEGAK